MKLLYDFFPLLCFFIAYKLFGIYVGTAVLIIASAIQVGYSWFKYRKIIPMHLVAFILLLIFGGMTLWLHDAEFLKWKVSLVNWLFAGIFFASQLFGTPIIQRLMASNLSLPRLVWQRLNALWGLFFLVLGCLNYFVMHHYSTEVWVEFKVFGILGLTVVFIIIQAIYLYPHLKTDSPHN
jgi:intracellular septation protein